MNRMISYYELLGMIKDGNIPNKIKLHMCGTSRIYVADYDDEDFSNYCLENIDDKSDDFRCYLGECFLESDMFKEDIEIIEENNKIEHIDINYFDDEKYTAEQRINVCMNITNDLIDEINKLKENK